MSKIGSLSKKTSLTTLVRAQINDNATSNDMRNNQKEDRGQHMNVGFMIPATKRPTGVTVLAFLQVANGAFTIFTGLSEVVSLLTSVETMGVWEEFLYEEAIFASMLGVFALLLGLITVLLAALSFILAYGYWEGKGWAWTLGLIFTILNIILDFTFLFFGRLTYVVIFGIIVNFGIIYYLMMADVKKFFGKGVIVLRYPESPHRPIQTDTHPLLIAKGIFCKQCGKLVSAELKLCPNCGKELKTE